MPLAKALDRAAKEIGVNFIGGFSALVQKGYQKGMKFLLIRSQKLLLKRTLSVHLLILVQPSREST